MSEMLELIVTYGTLPVLVAVAVFIIITYLKNQDKQNKEKAEELKRREQESEKLESKMQSQYAETLRMAMSVFNPIHEKEEEEENQKYNEIVFDQLYKLLLNTMSCRAVQICYHNGGRDATGRSFQKASMMHEAVSFGTAQVAGSSQNLPRMLLPTLSTKIATEGYYYVKDIESIIESDVFSYQTFKERGVKAFFITSLKDSSDKVLGYIGIEYASEPPEDLKRIKGYLTRAASKISGLMEGIHL